jgi:hypothetical protein
MKKRFLIAALITGLSCSVYAQKQAPKERLANLNLTEQQKSSVDSVRKAFDKKRAAVKKDATLSQEEQTSKLKEIRKEQNTAINSILTPEQREQLKKESQKKEGK